MFIEQGRRNNVDVDGKVGPGVLPVLSVEGEEVGKHGPVAPMPEEGTLRAATPGLPSETIPSDHVSLVLDLSFAFA